MSKARLVITAVTIEKRQVSEVARAYGVARSWIYALLEPVPGRGRGGVRAAVAGPRTSPGATAPATVDLIVRLRKELTGQGLDAGADTICWHLEHHHQVGVAGHDQTGTCSGPGLVVPEPRSGRSSSYMRFAAEQPNECWQSDFTHYPLACGTGTEILSWIDDYSRLRAVGDRPPPVTGAVVLATFRAAAAAHGSPASTLTDNGLVFTTRLSGGKAAATASSTSCAAWHHQKNGKPNHPQTQGKVERFQQTLKKWLRAQPPQPATSPSSRP